MTTSRPDICTAGSLAAYLIYSGQMLCVTRPTYP